jgi:hypothetical protein
MNVTSDVLNLKISFYFRRWLTSDTTEVFLRLLRNPEISINCQHLGHSLTLVGKFNFIR